MPNHMPHIRHYRRIAQHLITTTPQFDNAFYMTCADIEELFDHTPTIPLPVIQTWNQEMERRHRTYQQGQRPKQHTANMSRHTRKLATRLWHAVDEFTPIDQALTIYQCAHSIRASLLPVTTIYHGLRYIDYDLWHTIMERELREAYDLSTPYDRIPLLLLEPMKHP